MTEGQVFGNIVVHQMQVVSLSSPLTFEFLGHVADNFVLLGMHGHDAAMFGNFLKNAPQRTVWHTYRVEGRKNFETGDAFLNGLANLTNRFGRDVAGQDVMEGIVRVTVRLEGRTSLLHIVHNRASKNAPL